MANNRLLSALLFVLLTAWGYCSTSECPPQEGMPDGCSCMYEKGIKVHCYGNRENAMKIEDIAAVLREKYPANTTKINFLHFEEFNQSDTLSSRIFEGLRVRILYFEDCKIVSWADEFGGPAFVELEDSLEHLYIAGSIFLADEYRNETEMPAPFTMSHLHRLTKVWFGYNRLYVFGKDWFGNGGSSVQKLDITINKIHIIEKGALVGLTNLSDFVAIGNKIKELTRSTFSEDSKLAHLDLVYNKLEGFSEDFFVNFPALKSLRLSGNPIMFLPENVYGKIWSQLEKIDLYDSLLHCDDHVNWMLKFKQPFNFNVVCETPFLEHGDRLSRVLEYRRKRLERP